jgi:surface polysaccharide O-acyltransferase-like enzyme
MFHCFLAWRCQPFNSKFNSILEIVLSGLNAASTIVAVVGATDASRTEEAGDIIFYVFLGIAIVFAITLFVYDRVRVPHIEDMSLPFWETLPPG